MQREKTSNTAMIQKVTVLSFSKKTKWAKDLNRPFSKETCRWLILTKKCSTSLIIREMQIKTEMRYHLIHVRMAIINKLTNNKYWWVCGEKGNFCTVGGNADWCSHCGKQYADTSKNYEWIWLLTQWFHFWQYIQRNPKH